MTSPAATARAPTSSPIQDDDHFLPPHLLTNYPPIFVLPTRLTLEGLHTLEDNLARLDATLTYDIAEARIVLGTIGQRKRAALELRTRGVWTEEVLPFASDSRRLRSDLGSVGNKNDQSDSKTRDSPSPKRRRLVSSSKREESRIQSQQEFAAELSSTESEGADTQTQTQKQSQKQSGRQFPVRHEQQRKLSQASESTNATTAEGDDNQQASAEETHTTSNAIIMPDDHVKVVRLEWVTQSIKAQRALDIDEFVVYHGKVIARPDQAISTTTKTTTKTTALKSATKANSQGILARAIEDAASRPAQPLYGSRSGLSSSTRRTDPSQHPHPPHPPPTLYRQSTSEHDQPHLIPPAPDWVKAHVMYACMRSAPLHPPNEEFINQLVKIRKIRELTLDEIGVRAYSTSIAAIAAYPYELRSPVEILSLPGCDTKIANLFVEFRNSNTTTATSSSSGNSSSVDDTTRKGRVIKAAEALDTDPALSTIHQFYNIWGVGAKKAREFYYQRQWRDLDDVVEHGWNTLSRVQQIGVKYYDEFLAGIPRAEVSGIANIIHKHAQLVRPDCDYDGRGIECILVGGYRRGKEIQGDIDIVLSHRDERVTKNLVVDILASLESEGWVTHTLALHMTSSNREQQTLPFHGDPGVHHFDSLDKALVVWQDPHFENETETTTATETETEVNSLSDSAPKSKEKQRNPNPHRRVDIIISPWRTVGCAVLGWSGDTTFERDLRRYAKKKHDWKFDSSGVRERTTGGNVIDLEGSGSTWEERERLVMEGLGVGWRPASERCTR